MIDREQFLDLVIEPALKAGGLYSPSACMLLLGTAIIESELTFIAQHNGPALGLYQMEPATYTDLLRYLNKYENAALKERVISSAFYAAWPPIETLISNARWATLCARLKYKMITAALPRYNDYDGLAQYYKKWYNTPKGKTSIEKAISMFRSLDSFVDRYTREIA